ncbi:methionine sulfoxide reductase [Bowmanella dokdonensis]
MQMDFNSKALLLTALLFSQSLWASDEHIKITPGLYEGVVTSGFKYRLLEIKEDGQHRLFNMNMFNAFTSGQVFRFSDQDITCTRTECTIHILSAESGEITRLVLSPYLDDSFKVLEIFAEAEGDASISETYQLDFKKKQSTIRDFMGHYRDSIKTLAEEPQEGMYGFWIGVLQMDELKGLLTFEFHPDKKSHFTYFINGRGITNQTAFLPDKVNVKEGVVEIQTEHPTFANRLIVNQMHGDNLNGYFYSVYKGKTLQTGTFTLVRVRLPKEGK